MEMPRPTPAHQRLARLAGRWSGGETIHPSQWDPRGGTAVGRHDARVSLAQFAVIEDYEQQKDGETVYTGHGVWTIEPSSGDTVLYWFDSIGMGLETFRGGWDGDVLTLRSHGAMGHLRLAYDLSQEGTIRIRMDTSRDGEEWSAMMEGVYRPE